MTIPGKQKGNHYTNHLILSKEGKPLSTVNEKRLNWYLKRNLANEVFDYPDKNYPRVIQLTFKTKKDSAMPDDPAILPVENRCVVCGSTQDLSLHHVVPHHIKKFYPDDKKDFTRHLCVLLCEQHHIEIEKVNQVSFDNPSRQFAAFKNAVMNPIQIFLDKFRKLYMVWWIRKNGGIKNINRIFIQKFLEQKPKYLPKGWLNHE